MVMVDIKVMDIWVKKDFIMVIMIIIHIIHIIIHIINHMINYFQIKVIIDLVF